METDNALRDFIFNDEKAKLRMRIAKAAESARKTTLKRKLRAPLSVIEKAFLNK